MTTSDHVPCVISIKTNIPKAKIFRFENYWMEYDDFLPLVESIWYQSIYYGDAAKRISAKLKLLSGALKKWAKGHQNLKNLY